MNDYKPVKREVLKVLNSINNCESKALLKLAEKKDKDANARTAHEKTDKTLQRLLGAEDRASDAYYTLARDERQERANKTRVIREKLYLEGPTPDVIQMIQNLLKEYPIVDMPF